MLDAETLADRHEEREVRTNGGSPRLTATASSPPADMSSPPGGYSGPARHRGRNVHRTTPLPMPPHL